MDLLPTPEVRDWLLTELAGLIARRGFATFVSSPIVTPIPRCFPDPYRPDARGVRTVARRLLGYAGLGALDVDVELFENEARAERSPDGHRERHRGTAAWFDGIVDGTCRFGADTQ